MREDFWVYILTNERRTTLYVGVTNDLTRRVSEHGLKESRGFTWRHNLEVLLFWEHFSDPRQAIAREKQLKDWSRKKKEGLIATLNPEWTDLREELYADYGGLAAVEAAQQRSQEQLMQFRHPERSAANDARHYGWMRGGAESKDPVDFQDGHA